APDEPPLGELTQLAEARAQMQAQLERGAAYRSLVGRLAQDLAADRRGLAEAGELLRDTDRGRDPTWLDLLPPQVPSRPDHECPAANLMTRAVTSLRRDPEAARLLGRRLAEEFASAYGRPAPPLPAVAGRLAASPPEAEPVRGLTPAERLEDPVGASDDA